jgi:hypothetical protein
MNSTLKKAIVVALPVALAFSSCKKDSPEPVTETTTSPNYTVPTTYNFNNVDFSSSTNRISMLGEMTTYIRTAHTATVTPSVQLDAQKLKDMYANANSQFTLSTLNTSGIQLKDQTSNAFSLPADLEASFDGAASASVAASANPMAVTASNGVAGKLISGSGSTAKSYLVDANGVEFKEYAEKGIMGAVFYSKATTILTSISTYDNTTVTNGTTAQERAWDEAFGYFGVPVDFPTNVTGLKNWGSYCNAVSTSLGGTTTLNTTVMNAWLKGRAAISAKDDAGRNEARNIVLASWEKVCAGRLITYMKSAKTNIADDALRSHNLYEAIGFISSFR